MAAKDFREELEPAIRPFLADGDRLPAVSRLIADPGSSEDVSLTDELKNLLDPTLYLGLGAHPGGILQQAAFGRALVGGPDSSAGQVFAAVEQATSKTLAVSGRELLILSVVPGSGEGNLLQRWFGPVRWEATLHLRLPLSAVAHAQPAPKGALRRGRILIGFRDGSGCALVCAPPSQTPLVVAALNSQGEGNCCRELR